MGHRSWPSPARALGLALAAALTWGSAPPAGAALGPTGPDRDLCERFGPPEVAGALEAPALVELSGLAASPRHPGVLWAHNDSGAPAELHALGPDGADLGTYAVEGAEAVDWEDMAVGPGPDGDPVLYVGDVGDNRGVRDSTTIYRVAEPAGAPDGTGGSLSVVDATELRYPGGAVDVEALLVDPIDGDVLLITKDLLGASRVLQVRAALLGSPNPVEVADVGGFQPLAAALSSGLPGTMVTGADVASDGSVVLVRTYQAVLAFARPAGAPLADAFAARPCLAPQASEPQGEAIAFTAEGDAYVTISEGLGAPVHRFPVAAAEAFEPTEPPSVPDLTAPSTTAEASSPPDPQGSSSAERWPYVVVAAVAVAGLAAVAVVRRRRR